MTEPNAASNPELTARFAALVALVAERPSAVAEQREAVKGVIEAAKQGSARLLLGEGGLLADDVPFDSPLLATRFETYGIEELGITASAAAADLMDLARLLATPPTGDDPAGRFAGRAAAIDAKALPRRLRPRVIVAPAAEPAPVAAAAAAPAVAPTEPEAARRDQPERLTEALPVPVSKNAAIAEAVTALRTADGLPALQAALDHLILMTELAFRTGRHDDLIESLAAVVAIEYEALEKDSSDERRQAFNHSIRRLARPVLLRQLTVLRHERIADATAVSRLQASLYRFGVDGAESVVDEYVSAPSREARATCLETLRGLRCTYDALLALARDTSDLVVRQAASILGELRDPRGEAILVELLQHPDARARRAAVAALANFGGGTALEALGVALQDESPLVRLRAVAALTGMREARAFALLAPLLDAEPDRDVLYAAIGAVGGVGSPEALQVLIRLANGEGRHPLHRSAGMRLQACGALVVIRTPAAMAAVQGLREDRDREVREAALRLVAQAQRRTTTSMPALAPST